MNHITSILPSLAQIWWDIRLWKSTYHSSNSPTSSLGIFIASRSKHQALGCILCSFYGRLIISLGLFQLHAKLLCITQIWFLMQSNTDIMIIRSYNDMVMMHRPLLYHKAQHHKCYIAVKKMLKKAQHSKNHQYQSYLLCVEWFCHQLDWLHLIGLKFVAFNRKASKSCMVPKLGVWVLKWPSCLLHLYRDTALNQFPFLGWPKTEGVLHLYWKYRAIGWSWRKNGAWGYQSQLGIGLCSVLDTFNNQQDHNEKVVGEVRQ